jgi:myosin-5
MAAKDCVWVPDGRLIWRLASVIKRDTETVTVEGIPTPTTLKVMDTAVYDPSHDLDLRDAADLNSLHEAPLLSLIARRYALDKIYTYVSDVLVSVNPHKDIPGLYDAHPPYRHAVPMDAEAHIFRVAQRALQAMALRPVDQPWNQSIVISGESGAGKTEAAKYVMRYLIGQSLREQRRTLGGHALHDAGVEGKLLHANIVFEAFGNAKTLHHHNSSRFGKYIKLLYSSSSTMVQAETLHFLLEKSRAKRFSPGERNFHVFYHLCAGLTSNKRAEIGLCASSAYLMTANTAVLSKSFDDSARFILLVEALEGCGVALEEQSEIWKLLAALLELGNTRALSSDAQGVDSIGEAVTACQNFHIDTLSSHTGMCKCGALKEAHRAAKRSGASGERVCIVGRPRKTSSTPIDEANVPGSIGHIAALLGVAEDALQHACTAHGIFAGPDATSSVSAKPVEVRWRHFCYFVFFSLSI